MANNRTAFEARMEKRRAVVDAEARGTVADSMAVRMALMERVHTREMTLEQAQAELKRIQRGAAAAGKITRAQAFNAG